MPREYKALRIVGRGDNLFATGTETAKDLTIAPMLTDSGKTPRWLYLQIRVETTFSGPVGMMATPGQSGATPAVLENTGILVRKHGRSRGKADGVLVDVRGFDTLWFRTADGSANGTMYAHVVEPIFE